MCTLIALCFILTGGPWSPDSVSAIVREIRRADYRGDRAALKTLYDALAPSADTHARAAQIRYWRGFALWRRALNGFNESPGPDDQEADLRRCVSEFESAAAEDSTFVDAKVGAASCLQNLAYFRFTQHDTAQARELMQRSYPLLQQAEAQDPENPRLLWVLGASRWYAPPARGGGQAVAMETYQRGLRSARAHTSDTTDALAPSWGEPELLMNLAFANLNRTTPDFSAAEQYAQQALALVPYWHYVRDILLPQIRAHAPTRRQ
jgi:hypothetical protein